MKLERVWIICRSGSQSAERAAVRCAEQLKGRGSDVVTASSGLYATRTPAFWLMTGCQIWFLCWAGMARCSAQPAT